jgi:hypothetical protein
MYTGSQVINLAWSKLSSELVSFLQIGVVLTFIVEMAMPWLKRLVAGFPPRWPGFVVDKVALRQVFSEYFGFPCQSSFHQFPPTITITYHPGLVQ